MPLSDGTSLNRAEAVSLRGRVFTASAVFFLVIAALVVTVIVSFRQQADHRDKLAAFSGSAVNIERANGLIYAIVMESRGIYMSSEPALVKRYGDAVLRRSVQLANVLADWEGLIREDDAAQFAAFKERIQDFLRFRAELVRRAMAIGQDASRAFGDNEANRAIRIALNDDLEELGRINARRTAQIVALGEQGRLLDWLLLALGLVATGIAVYLATLIRSSILAPLHDLAAMADRIVGGKGARGDEIGRLWRALRQMQDTLLKNEELQLRERTASRRRDHLEILLQENRRHLLAAINNMTPGLLMLDLEGKVILINDAYRKLYRIPDSLPDAGLTFRDIVVARADSGTFTGNVDAYVAAILARIEQAKPAVRQIELKDGRVIRIVERPMNGGCGWVATHEDATEQRQVQRSLERTELMLGQIIENVGEAIVAKDAATLRYILVNRAAELLFGVERAAMLGKTTAQVFAAETAAWIEHGDRALQQGASSGTEAELPIETPGNGRRLVAIRRLPLAGQDGAARVLLSVIEDRTPPIAEAAE
jgi:PAS domain S-box-containing protein